MEEDAEELIALNLASRELHQPWVYPPVDMTQYWAYLLRCNRNDAQGYLVCLRDGGAIVGVVNLSQIFRGNFCSSYLGYYTGQAYAGRGLMTEGLSLVVDEAFSELELHRLEANIQPGNLDSIRLVKRLGFVYEGLSSRYLRIGGQWRDHERWALLSEDWKRA